MKKLLLAGISLFAIGNAYAQIQQPPGIRLSAPVNSNGVLNPSPFSSNDYGFGPYGLSQLVTNQALTGQTLLTTMEVPSDFVALKLWFANILGSTWGITDITVAPSSQWAAPGSAANQYGVSVFDASGTDITATAGTWQIVSWGLNGANGSWIQNPSDYTNIAATTTLTSSSCPAGVLALTSATGVAVGQTALPFNPENNTNSPLIYHVTTVAGLNVTVDGTPTCNSGDTWKFLPIGITVPAAVNPPVPSIVVTDPIHTISVPRIDGPVINGETLWSLAADGTPTNTGLTANVITNYSKPLNATSSPSTNSYLLASVTLSGGTLPTALPAGSKVCFSSTISTNGTITATNTIPLVSGTGVANGMVAVIGLSSPFTSVAYDATFTSVVSNVAGNSITTTDMIDPPFGGATWSGTMSYESSTPTGLLSSGVAGPTPLTMNGAVISGTTALVVNDPNSVLTAWQSAISGGVSVFAASSNLQAISAAGVSVTSIVPGTKTINLAAGTNGALLNGQPIILYMAATISGTITAPSAFVMAAGATNNMIPGSLVVGAGWKNNTHLTSGGSTNFLTMSLDKSPTATVSTSTSTALCHQPMTLALAAPVGASVLYFTTTKYKNHLVAVRINYASNGMTLYPGPGQDWGAAIDAGLQQFMGYFCNPANDVVLSPNLCTNSSGAATLRPTNPVFKMQILSPIPVESIGVLGGDSKFQGSTTPYNSLSFPILAAEDMWTPALPTSPINCDWGAAAGSLFMRLAKICLGLNPGIVVIQGMPNNWPATTQGYAQAISGSVAIAGLARRQGALTVMTDDYPGGGYGLTTLGNINPYQLSARAYLSQFSSLGGLYFDTTSVVGVTNTSGTYLSMSQGYSGDGLHLLLSGHQALETPFINLIQPFVKSP